LLFKKNKLFKLNRILNFAYLKNNS